MNDEFEYIAPNVRADDIRQFLDLMPMVLGIHDELKELILTNANVKELVSFDSWANYYETPFSDLSKVFTLCMMALALDEKEQKQVAGVLLEAANPLLGSIASIAAVDKIFEDSSIEKVIPVENQKMIGQFFPMLVACLHALRSVMLVGRFMNDLIAEAREGNDKALFAAIRIDPIAAGCSSAQNRIAKAYTLNDTTFIKKLHLTQSGELQSWREKDFMDMRMTLEILHELGVSKFSDAQLEDLFSKKLRRYFYNKGDGGKAKALRKFVNEYMKSPDYYEKSTST